MSRTCRGGGRKSARAGGLCGDGTVFVSLPSRPGPEDQVWTLDRNEGTWKLVSVEETLPSRWRHVYGCDDEGLVMNYSAVDTGRGLIWLRPAGQP